MRVAGGSDRVSEGGFFRVVFSRLRTILCSFSINMDFLVVRVGMCLL